MSHSISRTQCIAAYHLEADFFDALCESELIRVVQSEDDWYLDEDDLDILERYAYLHYDLEINVAGLEVIDRLLRQIEDLQQKNRRIS